MSILFYFISADLFGLIYNYIIWCIQKMNIQSLHNPVKTAHFSDVKKWNQDKEYQIFFQL